MAFFLNEVIDPFTNNTTPTPLPLQAPQQLEPIKLDEKINAINPINYNIINSIIQNENFSLKNDLNNLLINNEQLNQLKQVQTLNEITSIKNNVTQNLNTHVNNLNSGLTTITQNLNTHVNNLNTGLTTVNNTVNTGLNTVNSSVNNLSKLTNQIQNTQIQGINLIGSTIKKSNDLLSSSIDVVDNKISKLDNLSNKALTISEKVLDKSELAIDNIDKGFLKALERIDKIEDKIDDKLDSLGSINTGIGGDIQTIALIGGFGILSILLLK